MNASPRTYLGIDVGGTKVAAGLADLPHGNAHARRTIPTQAERGGEAALAATGQLAREMMATARSKGLEVAGIGLGVCELVAPDGSIKSANCLPWTREAVQKELGSLAPLTIEADVRAAALAEANWGAGRGSHVFLYVTVGTGISSCLMLNGQPYLGARGLTGTMASSSLSFPCEQCGKINRTELEKIASGPALALRLNRAAPGRAANGREVLAAAEAGDSLARDVVASAGEALESVVALLINVLDPEKVVLGGGLGSSEGLFWDSFVAATRRHIWSEAHRDLPIVRAATGPDAGWLGAALAAANAQVRRS